MSNFFEKIKNMFQLENPSEWQKDIDNEMWNNFLIFSKFFLLFTAISSLFFVLHWFTDYFLLKWIKYFFAVADIVTAFGIAYFIILGMTYSIAKESVKKSKKFLCYSFKWCPNHECPKNRECPDTEKSL